MTKFRASEIKSLNTSGPIGSILYIGAGQADLLDSCLAIKPAKIILVEANPNIAAHLKRQAKQYKNVSFFPLAVSEQNSPSQFTIFNMAGFSSLHKPTGLKTLFPSLRQVKIVDVDSINVTGLLKKISLGTENNHILILDAAGEDESIIQALIANDTLLQFSHIFLCAPALALYDGNSPGDTLLQELFMQGYEQQAQDNKDPDIAQYHLKRSPLALKLNSLSGENENLTKELHIQQETIDRVILDRDKLEKDKAAKDTEIEGLHKSLKDFENQLTDLRNSLEHTKSEHDKTSKDNIRKDAENQSAQRDMSLALRMQSLRETDLGDLRKSYAFLLSQKEAQDILLQKLTERLSAAAMYLAQMKTAPKSSSRNPKRKPAAAVKRQKAKPDAS